RAFAARPNRECATNDRTGRRQVSRIRFKQATLSGARVALPEAVRRLLHARGVRTQRGIGFSSLIRLSAGSGRGNNVARHDLSLKILTSHEHEIQSSHL